jgi:predicted MFS family arabinose efflux permease
VSSVAECSYKASTIAEREPDRARWRMLWMLVLALIISNIDRNVISVLLEPIRLEFSLKDWQLGLLAGLTFTALYSLGSLFISRLAERYNRVTIVSAGLLVWSTLTFACGLADSYAQLLAARAGVGLSESSAQAPSHALIADAFHGRKRSLAMGIYASGAMAGAIIALPLGGYAAQHFGWRGAFWAVSVPGILLSFALWLTVRDPRDDVGNADLRPIGNSGNQESLLQAVRALAKTPAIRHLILGAVLSATAGAASLNFGAAVLMRTHGLSGAQAGLALGLVNGGFAILGAISGGWLVGHALAHDHRWRTLLPMWSQILTVPAIAGFLLFASTPLAIVSGGIAAYAGAMWLGPTFAVLQDCVDRHRRATAAACLLISYNLIGFGLGPLVAGIISDRLKVLFGAHALAMALLTLQPFALWGALHFFLASRRLLPVEPELPDPRVARRTVH